MWGPGAEVAEGRFERGLGGIGKEPFLTEEIGQLVVSRATPHEVRAAAVAQGMRPMRVEAAHLIASDLTTVDEVHRSVFIAGSTYVPPVKAKPRARKAAAKPAGD
jgi:type II secretory ATPase GspE/PulE/Tfp pilus assembly ATPase PilB-like protein